VLHVHAPLLWDSARALGIPFTRPDVAYGTPAMADEMERLYRAGDFARRGIVAMGGHADGVVAFGADPGAAGFALLGAFVGALARN